MIRNRLNITKKHVATQFGAAFVGLLGSYYVGRHYGLVIRDQKHENRKLDKEISDAAAELAGTATSVGSHKRLKREREQSTPLVLTTTTTATATMTRSLPVASSFEITKTETKETAKSDEEQSMNEFLLSDVPVLEEPIPSAAEAAPAAPASSSSPPPPPPAATTTTPTTSAETLKRGSIHYPDVNLTELPLYIKGRVIHGFGRGSKELGVPTANLPVDPYERALRTLPLGIYYGFARVVGDGDKDEVIDDHVYGMAMSVGLNPFYHNETKTLEVHIFNQYDHDFYDYELRGVAIGFVRPEANFDSLDSLISAINDDISFSKRQLESVNKINL